MTQIEIKLHLEALKVSIEAVKKLKSYIRYKKDDLDALNLMLDYDKIIVTMSSVIRKYEPGNDIRE